MRCRCYAVVVVAKEYKNRVLEIAAVFCHLHELANIKIQQAHGIVLGSSLESMRYDFLLGHVINLKTLIILGNGKGPVICGGLDVGKKRALLRLLCQNPVNLPE